MFDMSPYKNRGISAWNPFSEMEKKDKYVRCERSYGSYSRSFDVSGIDASQIKAYCDGGVLDLKMPKKAAAIPAPTQIEIN